MSHIQIFVDENLGSDTFNEIADELKSLELEVEIKETKTLGPYASLDWIIPTAATLIIFKPYYETFLKKAAEDHYEMLKNFLKGKLYNQAINAAHPMKIITMGGIEKEIYFSMDLSVQHKIVKNEKTIHLKLMFPKDCEPEYFEKSISTFIKLQQELEDKEQSALLFDGLVKAERGMLGTKVVWFNEEIDSLEFLNTIESARTKSLVPIKFA